MRKDTAKRICFNLDKNTIKKLKIYCAEHDMSMSQAIEKLINEQL